MHEKDPQPIRAVVPAIIHGPKGKAETWHVVEGARMSRKMRRAMGVK
jgi:hypothetical protein